MSAREMTELVRRSRRLVEAKQRGGEAGDMNDLYHSVFTTEPGRQVLGNLIHLVGEVMPPTATDAELRYREGQRAIVAMIQSRVQAAAQRKDTGE